MKLREPLDFYAVSDQASIIPRKKPWSVTA
jgi:hypothetical protein